MSYGLWLANPSKFYRKLPKLITDKTLRLLEMDSQRIKFLQLLRSSEVPISKLANSICADEIGGACNVKNKHPLTSFNKKFSNTGINYRSWARGVEDDPSNNSLDPLTLKTKEFSRIAVSRYKDLDLEKHKGKRPREEYLELSSLKRPKQERAPVPQGQLGNKPRRIDGLGMPTLSKPKSCQSVDKMVAKAPYFFYGNVMNLSQDCWVKISQFLYAIEPEFVNSQFFSALSRKEGYIHNLPSQNRFHITPKPPMTIEAAIPHTKKWWPLWDPRKQLSCISFEINGVSELCDRLGKILTDSKGILSAEKQRDLLHQCRALNLVWVGRHKLGPVEPEHLERILGYPLNHTRDSELSLKERLQSLKHSFQIDTLGYHLSVLKSLYPGGLTVLSIYSGIGGAEISLHRLGIRLKGVVSIEPCERKRKILKKWWQSTGQTGELVQIEGIQRLASNKLESLIKQFGGFDFIICQNPYTYSSKIPTMAADGDSVGDLDFSLFYEFVRVLQRVRSTMERSK
ncbi:probable inactive DNA (cytosine-5)-methyltransferase DRM3 [Camellia sinensis]|uniref:probable inactive DNA (cytosine-5)-methyltransferase DRM3 n=1 Tax=Camellia sinensis TaxID=4442 RepID=UPI0010369823|nr:probable inactive DNA (cytosine-5)-methyltransferase DRM3 [Camellia sinensis]